MVDFVTTNGRLVMSADEDTVAAFQQKGDVLQMSDGTLYIIMQRTWLYERAGIEIVNPLDKDTRSTGVRARLQIVVEEVRP